MQRIFYWLAATVGHVSTFINMGYFWVGKESFVFDCLDILFLLQI